MTGDIRELSRVPLLERDPEMAVLRSALEAAADGRGRVVVIEGEPGIGKTCLADTVLDDGRAQGMQVLGARGAEAELDFPFGVALQLFESRVTRAEDAERAELLAGAAELAAGLLADRTETDDERSLFSLVHGLYWLAANLAERRPLLLVVDDVQWADAGSLRFLGYLAHRLADLPVALVMTLRTGEPAAQRAAVAALAGDDNAHVLRPRVLSEAAVGRFVRRFVDGAGEEFCAACAAASGGNPFLLREILLTMRAEGVAPTREGAARVREVAPQSIARSVLRRLGRLGDDALALARSVALLGADASVEHAAALARLDPDT